MPYNAPWCGWMDKSWVWAIEVATDSSEQRTGSAKGAHLLLQVRTHVLNGDWEATVRGWYAGFRSEPMIPPALPFSG